MAEQLQVPFKLPAALPGLPNPPQPPASIDQITWAYLAELLVYHFRLNTYQLHGYGLIEPQMLTETELHKTWVATYLVNQKPPLPSINLPSAPAGDLHVLLTNGFRDVTNKLDGLATDVKKLQADSIKTNEKLDGLATDVKKLQADSIKTNEKLDGLTTDVKKLQADSVKTNEKLDGLTTDVKKLQADSIKTNEKLDGLTTDVKKLQADSVKTEEKLDGLTTDTSKLYNSVNALDAAFDKMGERFNSLKQSLRDNEADNEAGFRALNRTITDLPASEGFRQAVSASITENERIIEMENTINGHTETLNRMSTNTLESLRRRVDRVDRLQSQVFNASRESNQSWLPICNKDGVLPSEQGLVVVGSRSHLSNLQSRQIAQLLAFYDCIPSDFPAANTLEIRAANFVRQSRHWTAEVHGGCIGILGDILTNPSAPSWHNEGND